jgi:hypothetical protein
MLKGVRTDKNLIEIKNILKSYLPDDLQGFWIEDNTIEKLNYPINVYPQKVKSVNLQKTNVFNGKLIGIKGQYLIFEGGEVLNIRNHSGLVVGLSF